MAWCKWQGLGVMAGCTGCNGRVQWPHAGGGSRVKWPGVMAGCYSWAGLALAASSKLVSKD